MVSGSSLFLALFHNLAIFIALVAVYGTLIGKVGPSGPVARQGFLGIAFGLFALGCMYARIPVAAGVIVDQRNAIVALSGIYGGPLAAVIAAVIAAAYRGYLGGIGMLSGVTGIALAALSGIALRRWLGAIDSIRKSALAALLATLAILPGFLLYGPWPSGAALLGRMALPYGMAILLGVFLVGLLLSRENERVQAERRFRAMFELAPDAMMVLDAERRVRLLNARAASLSGLAPREVIGRPLGELDWLTEAARSKLDERLGRPGQGAAAEAAFEMQTRDGKRTLEANLGEMLLARQGLQWLVVLRDVTERKRAEEARAEFEARIAQSHSLESLGRLAAGVAHDFNNLLTVILTTADLAGASKDRGLDPATCEDLRGIAEAGRKAAELTAQLLAFGRKQALAPKVLSLGQVVEGILPLLRRSLPENIAVELEHGPATANVTADPAQLEQVIVNLVVNARDAMASGGRLSIATRNRDLDESYAASHPEVTPGHYVELAVRDTGVGMDHEVRERIFEPFYTTKAQGKGTGLGLATVHGIVRQSGGHIFVDSEPGRGTCFRVYFPSTREAPTEVAPPVDGPLEPASGHVLLVEDNEPVRKAIARMLRSLGMQVTEASGAREALEALRAPGSPIGVLLSDVVLRDGSGLELGKQAVQRHPSIRVLHMSGYTAAGMGGGSRPGPGVHLIAKPFTREDLQRAMQRLASVPGEGE